jgi:hypothetical protein
VDLPIEGKQVSVVLVRAPGAPIVSCSSGADRPVAATIGGCNCEREADAMSVVDCRDAVLDREVVVLLADLAGSVPAEVVRELVSSVRDDLAGQVPVDALPEFMHRSAVQRLIDRHGDDR